MEEHEARQTAPVSRSVMNGPWVAAGEMAGAGWLDSMALKKQVSGWGERMGARRLETTGPLPLGLFRF